MKRRVAEFSVDQRMFSLVGPRLYEGNLAAIWARETLQNSVDAGASNINITARQVYHAGELPDDLDPDEIPYVDYGVSRGKVFELTCEDDGGGMSEDTFIDAFLRLGGSEKADFSIGGWGVAKAIILCGQWWEVESNGFRCTSDMIGRQPVEELNEPRTGTKITMRIALDDEQEGWKWDTTDVRQCLRLSRLPGMTVTCNDEVVEHVRIGKEIADLGWCKISTNESKGSVYPGMHIRAKGLYQFRKWLSGNTCVFVDIPDLPETVNDPDYPLTVSRESFVSKYGRQVNEVARTMIIEPKSSLSHQIDEQDEWFDRFILPPDAEPQRRDEREQQAARTGTASIDLTGSNATASKEPEIMGETLRDWQPPTGVEPGEEHRSPLPYPFGVMNHRDYDGVSPLESDRYLKIQNIWHELVVEAISCFGSNLTVDENLHTGFTMKPGCCAMFYKAAHSDIHYVLVNPTDVRLSDPMKINLPILLFLLCEEIVHALGNKLHDENLMGRTYSFWRKLMTPENYRRLEEAYKRGEEMGV